MWSRWRNDGPALLPGDGTDFLVLWRTNYPDGNAQRVRDAVARTMNEADAPTKVYLRPRCDFALSVAVRSDNPDA